MFILCGGGGSGSDLSSFHDFSLTEVAVVVSTAIDFSVHTFPLLLVVKFMCVRCHVRARGADVLPFFVLRRIIHVVIHFDCEVDWSTSDGLS